MVYLRELSAFTTSKQITLRKNPSIKGITSKNPREILDKIFEEILGETWSNPWEIIVKKTERNFCKTLLKIIEFHTLKIYIVLYYEIVRLNYEIIRCFLQRNSFVKCMQPAS